MKRVLENKISQILKYNEEEDTNEWQLGACTCGQEYIFREEGVPESMVGSPTYEICPVCNGKVDLPSPRTVVLWDENTQLTPMDRKVIARILGIGESVLALEDNLYYITCEGQVSHVRSVDPLILRYIYHPLPATGLLKVREWIRERYDNHFGDWMSAFEFVKGAHHHLGTIVASLNYWRESQLVLDSLDTPPKDE